jgi:hypothetical protein
MYVLFIDTCLKKSFIIPIFATFRGYYNEIPKTVKARRSMAEILTGFWLEIVQQGAHFEDQ